MAYVIHAESCSACGACAENCPENAITYVAGKAVYQIDPEKCVDCGACQDNCGSGAARSG